MNASIQYPSANQRGRSLEHCTTLFALRRSTLHVDTRNLASYFAHVDRSSDNGPDKLSGPLVSAHGLLCSVNSGGAILQCG
jgi:hypothetical protein